MSFLCSLLILLLTAVLKHSTDMLSNVLGHKNVMICLWRMHMCQVSFIQHELQCCWHEVNAKESRRQYIQKQKKQSLLYRSVFGKKNCGYITPDSRILQRNKVNRKCLQCIKKYYLYVYQSSKERLKLTDSCNCVGGARSRSADGVILDSPGGIRKNRK